VFYINLPNIAINHEKNYVCKLKEEKLLTIFSLNDGAIRISGAIGNTVAICPSLK
jgi:hypothetical protein